jgi:16S rRNA (guanine527-N7)-methyltransferase
MDIVLVKKYLRENLGFSDKKIQKIHKYIDLLLIFNKKYNLISKSTEKEIWNRHILDSAQIIKYIDFNKGHILSDFGSGAGLPGVIISIANTNPNFHVKLYEKSPVKSSFLTDISNILGLNCKIIRNDINTVKIDSNYIVCRAFRKLSYILNISRENCVKKHKIIILKGRNAQKEINSTSKMKNYKYRLENSITDNDSKIIILNTE